MTAKTEVVRARINPNLKHTVELILEKLGLSQSEAINMFYSQIALFKGLPFDVRIPTRETRKALEDGLKGINGKMFSSVEELFEDLEN